MFPFVSGIEQLRAGRAAVAPRRRDAARARRRRRRVEIGVMIEVPSAAMTADLLAREADFFSIGTNDLIQYCLAVDRTDDRVSTCISRCTRRSCARCAWSRGPGGAAASRSRSAARWPPIPACCTLLVGLGLREFSMAPGAIPLAKQVLRSLRTPTTPALAGRALPAATAADVEHALASC